MILFIFNFKTTNNQKNMGLDAISLFFVVHFNKTTRKNFRTT